jgi:hypothetical protein
MDGTGRHGRLRSLAGYRTPVIDLLAPTPPHAPERQHTIPCEPGHEPARCTRVLVKSFSRWWHRISAAGEVSPRPAGRIQLLQPGGCRLADLVLAGDVGLGDDPDQPIAF